MWKLLAIGTVSFNRTSSEKMLLLGIFIASTFFVIFLVTAHFENVLYIENGVGFVENYGLIAALICDALLFFLTKKYLAACELVYEKSSFGHIDRIQIAKNKLKNTIYLKTPEKFALLFFVLLGVIALSSNIALHIGGDVSKHWNGDVFDSLAHPYSFGLNKAFSFYSWCLVIPFCGFVALASTQFLGSTADAIYDSVDAHYDLLNSDNAGGFGQIRYAVMFFNLGIVLVYLQITLYMVTFSGLNWRQLIAYMLATLALLAANFIFFSRIERVIHKKRNEALDLVKSQAYDGDRLKFDILRYYLEEFSRKSLQRRLSLFVLTLKSVAIIIPPVIKGLLLVAS